MNAKICCFIRYQDINSVCTFELTSRLSLEHTVVNSPCFHDADTFRSSPPRKDNGCITYAVTVLRDSIGQISNTLVVPTRNPEGSWHLKGVRILSLSKRIHQRASLDTTSRRIRRIQASEVYIKDFDPHSFPPLL